MRFDIGDIGKKTKQHATECNRYLLELNKVSMYDNSLICSHG